MVDYPSEWTLVDVETSGLRPAEHRVLSIALMTIGPRRRENHAFSSLINPACDPGPVHIHGLTAERLAGAPTFEQVAGEVAALLQDRVMVAHNAQFDYGFLHREFSRAGLRLPVSRRMCTLTLNRRVAPPTPDLRLGTLAAHYGVTQRQAHDAADDTRVLAGILRGSLSAAERLGLSLPLVNCPPRQALSYPPRIPKTACSFRNPGRLSSGGRLVQGMKIAITGDTATPRPELAAMAVAAGLNLMSSVSRHTSVLVTNDPESGTGKARRAIAEGVPVVDEKAFRRMLRDVQPGVGLDEPQAPAVPRPRAPSRAATSETPAAEESQGVLANRRVLVIGGPHERAAELRRRVVDLGGVAAVNLSGRVTDVIALSNGTSDQRMARIATLGLPVHDAGWVQTVAAAPIVGPALGADIRTDVMQAPLVLPRGGATDLPVTRDSTRWIISASWAQQTACDVDVVAFAVDGDEQVACDEDFVFYSAPECPNGGVSLSADGPAEQAIVVDVRHLPLGVRKVVIAAAVDGTATFGEVGAIEITVAAGESERPLALATLDAATTEQTMLLAEVYRRGGAWRLRAVGQGYEHDLAGLARGFGVEVED